MTLPREFRAADSDGGASEILNFRMPAEWEPHAATWLGWPHAEETWPGCLERARAEFAALLRAVALNEPADVLVQDAAAERRVRALAAELPAAAGPVRVHRLATDDVWLRDIGPTFVHAAGGERAAIDWTFNAWAGKYPPWERDDAAAAEIARRAGVPSIRPGLTLEGGALEVDGAGTLLLAEPTALDPRRNPGVGRAQLEARLDGLLGVSRVIWLGEGIAGDDTDGHVDDVARFVAPGRVVCARERRSGDPNFEPTREAWRRLSRARDARGGRLELAELPLPEPQSAGPERLPASYANFYFAGRALLVPVFGCPQDEAALKVLEQLFPEREILPLVSRTLVRGLGGPHCLTQQEPRASVPGPGRGSGSD
ncbi:MAG: agmatine deiminase family protein [Proteobacteria bacterium]|nr:agmatine deiminase family protein [Pseudomonadota bacterium]